MKRRGSLAVLAGVLALTVTGCSLGVESFLQPPKLGGEQQAVQAALETYLRDKGDARYTLEYPVEGEHTAAFLLCDQQGYPVEENPSLAVAFYSLNAAPEETHVNLLRRSGEEWQSVADAVGSGVDVREVAFGDLNGDGRAELVTGWSTYYSRVDQLVVYALNDDLTPVSEPQGYSSVFVGDLTATGQDRLLVLTVSDAVTATLQQLEGERLNAVDTVKLDGGIQQFGQRTLCRLAGGVHGLYVEGLKADDTAVTELIYYDQEGLHAPFYDPETNATTVTTRVGRLAARDIDGDTRVEIPTPLPLEGHEEEPVGATLIQWQAWDYATNTWRHHSYTLVNQVDGYMVALDGDRHTHLDTDYDEQTHTLKLMDTATKRDWLWVSVGEEMADAPADDWEGLVLFSAGQSEIYYYAWFDPTVIEAEKVRYIVTPLAREGG